MEQVRTSPLSSPGFWGVTLDAGEESSSVRGFDQWKAFEFCFLTFAAAMMLGLPVLVALLKSWLLTAGVVTLVIVAAIAVAQLFRFRVDMSKAGFELRRSWAGIPYQRLRLDLASTVFEERGMGDWGEDESWPIRRFCEVIPKERRRDDIFIGTPRTADEIADFLAAQKARYLA